PKVFHEKVSERISPDVFVKGLYKEICHGGNKAGIRFLWKPSDPGKNERGHAALERFCGGPGGGDGCLKRRDICERVYEEDPKGKGNPSGRNEKAGIFHICLRGQLYLFQRAGGPSGKMPGKGHLYPGLQQLPGTEKWILPCGCPDGRRKRRAFKGF